MKQILFTSFFMCTLGVFAQLDRSKLPEASTPRPIEIGEYESFELKNGLKVFVIENNKLPRVSYSLLLDREPLLEKDKVGYLSMVGQMLRRGTETRSKEQLDEEVDFIGASLSASSSSVFASGLSKYTEKILELMTDVAFNPTFPPEELEKIRKQTLSGLAANKEDPNAIAGNLNQKLIYGSDHPYGEIQTEETTNNISVEDLSTYHQTYFKPNIAYLAVIGDVNLKQVKKLVKKYFGSWEPGDVPIPSYEMPGQPEKNQVNIVNRSNSVQSIVNVTYPVDLPVGSEDEIKVRVMNQVLGGSFSGKLNMNLREDKGYTYGSRSSLSSNDLVSRFNAGADVRNEVTDSTIVQILYELEQMRKGEITEEELELAKNSIAGSFSRSLERPQTVASFALNRAIYSYPEDYYSSYVQKVMAVSKEDVQAMAMKYLKPENAYINVVGKVSEIGDKLAQFGAVKFYDNYGNEVDPSLAKLPADVSVESVLADYKEALGGAAVDNIENVSINMSATMMGQQLALDMTMAKGLKSKVTVAVGPMVAMSAVASGEDAMTKQMGKAVPMKEDQKEELAYANGIFTEFQLLANGAKAMLTGVEQVNGKDAYAMEITLSKGAKYTLYFDMESGLKVRYSKVLELPQGTFNQIIDYGDYREIDGVMIYHSLDQQMGPQKMEATATKVMVNQTLAEGTFKVE